MSTRIDLLKLAAEVEALDKTSAGPYHEFERDLRDAERELRSGIATLEAISSDLGWGTSLDGPLGSLRKAFGSYTDWLKRAV